MKQKDALVNRESKMKKKYEDIRSEVNRIQNEGRKVTFAEVITTGQKKLYQQVTGKTSALVAANATGADASPSMMNRDNKTPIGQRKGG
jgi:hypothetical protein